MNSRRNFLKKASVLTLGGMLASESSSVLASPVNPLVANNKTLGLQIYSVEKEMYDDLPKRFAQLKEMGYVNLELCGYDQGKIRSVDMMDFKKMANDAGLVLKSSHIEPYIEGHTNPLLLDYKREMMPQVKEYWKRAADDNAKLGVKYLVQATMPTCMSHERAALLCEFFNESAQICKDAGLQYAYHNHHMEFERLLRPEDVGKNKNPWTIPGDQIIDLFIAGTDPSLVVFELDTYWTVRGGSDPVDFLKKYPERIKIMHIKDTSVLGQSGFLQFEKIFDQMYKNGIQEYFVEMERMRDGRTQFEGIKDCADYLQKASFVR